MFKTKNLVSLRVFCLQTPTGDSTLNPRRTELCLNTRKDQTRAPKTLRAQ